ncbi:hypothetical protein NKG94_51620 [Micromonospora sp. M12]
MRDMAGMDHGDGQLAPQQARCPAWPARPRSASYARVPART